MNGESGPDGSDANTCDSSGSMVRVKTKDDIIPILGIKLDSDFEMLDRIENPYCSDKLIASSIPVPTQNASKSLQPTMSIIEYKIFM